VHFGEAPGTVKSSLKLANLVRGGSYASTQDKAVSACDRGDWRARSQRRILPLALIE
jgi:hypothetical protein